MHGAMLDTKTARLQASAPAHPRVRTPRPAVKWSTSRRDWSQSRPQVGVGRRRVGPGLPRRFWAQIPPGLSLRPLRGASHVLAPLKAAWPLKPGTTVVCKNAVGLETFGIVVRTDRADPRGGTSAQARRAIAMDRSIIVDRIEHRRDSVALTFRCQRDPPYQQTQADDRSRGDGD